MERVCNKCKIKKDYAEFHKCESLKGGISYTCKDCISKANKLKYQLLFSINFEIFGLETHEKTTAYTAYRKYRHPYCYVEVFNFNGVISIDIINGNDRLVVASRYHYSTQKELTFLLTKGRAKGFFDKL